LLPQPLKLTLILTLNANPKEVTKPNPIPADPNRLITNPSLPPQ